MGRDSDELDNEIDFISKCFLHEDDNIENLPVPVYSSIKPTMGPHLILHISISTGNFSTEIDLARHAKIR